MHSLLAPRDPAVGGTLPTPCCLQITGDTAFFDLSLQSGRFASVGTGFSPYEFPWSAKPFSGFGKLVLRIIMLPEALFNITGLTAIVSTARFTLDDIDPVRQLFSHKKKPALI